MVSYSVKNVHIVMKYYNSEKSFYKLLKLKVFECRIQQTVYVQIPNSLNIQIVFHLGIFIFFIVGPYYQKDLFKVIFKYI